MKKAKCVSVRQIERESEEGREGGREVGRWRWRLVEKERRNDSTNLQEMHFHSTVFFDSVRKWNARAHLNAISPVIRCLFANNDYDLCLPCCLEHKRSLIWSVFD